MMFYLMLGAVAGLAIFLWWRPKLTIPESRHPKATPENVLQQVEPIALVLEMSATLLETGLPVRTVLEIIGENIPGYDPLIKVARALELNVSWERSWVQMPAHIQELELSLRFTQLSGAPVAKLLRAAAQGERKRQLRETEARGAEFGIKLVIPLGLCALPAFVCLGIVPIVISLLPDF